MPPDDSAADGSDFRFITGARSGDVTAGRISVARTARGGAGGAIGIAPLATARAASAAARTIATRDCVRPSASRAEIETSESPPSTLEVAIARTRALCACASLTAAFMAAAVTLCILPRCWGSTAAPMCAVGVPLRVGAITRVLGDERADVGADALIEPASDAAEAALRADGVLEL